MKFASFDPNASAPQPVLGWYDTAALDYPTLPPVEARCAMTDAEWAARLDGHWAVQDGALVSYTPTPSAEQAAIAARIQRNTLLTASDWTQMPDTPMGSGPRAAWATYRQALRDWPDQPGWPDAPLPTAP